MPLYASPYKVTIGSIVINFDDYLTTWPEFTGGFLAAFVDRVNATARKGFGRGNRWEDFDLAWMKEYATPGAAADAALAFPALVPTTRTDITIQTESGANKTLGGCLFPAHSARPEGHLVYYTLTVKGTTYT